MAGRRVDAAGAAVHGHVVGEDDRGGAVDEGVAGAQVLERAAGDRLDDGRGRAEAGGRRDGAQERARDDDPLGTQVGDHVVDVRIDRDGEVGRDRPGRRGPDDDAEGLVGGQAEARGLGVRNPEPHPDGGGGVLLVLDLGLRERRFEGDRPIDRLLASVDDALFDERGEDTQDVRLKGGRLGLVFVGPVREDAEPLELRRLLGDPRLGEGVAEAPELLGRDLPVRLP